jgi:hypothetical protein
MKTEEVFEAAQQIKNNHYLCPGECSNCLYKLVYRTNESCFHESFKELIDEISHRKLIVIF